jgi:hypothetical protein
MEFHKVLPNDPPIVMFAKMGVTQGRSPGLEKDAFYDAIVKRAEALRADGESASLGGRSRLPALRRFRSIHTHARQVSPSRPISVQCLPRTFHGHSWHTV